MDNFQKLTTDSGTQTNFSTDPISSFSGTAVTKEESKDTLTEENLDSSFYPSDTEDGEPEMKFTKGLMVIAYWSYCRHLLIVSNVKTFTKCG